MSSKLCHPPEVKQIMLLNSLYPEYTGLNRRLGRTELPQGLRTSSKELKSSLPMQTELLDGGHFQQAVASGPGSKAMPERNAGKSNWHRRRIRRSLTSKIMLKSQDGANLRVKQPLPIVDGPAKETWSNGRRRPFSPPFVLVD